MSSDLHTSLGGWKLSRRMFALSALLSFQGLAMAAGEPIVIGQVAPFTGPQAVTGLAMNAGAKLYFDSVNARGGVRGRPIKLVTRDDVQKPEDTVRLTKELIATEAPVAMISTVGTANLEALAKDGVLVRQRVSMIGAVSGAASVAQAEGMHVVKASYHDEVGRLFGQLAGLGVTTAGLVYQNDGLGRDVLAGAEAAARQSGIKLEVRSAYERNTTAVEKAVADMISSKVQVVFLGATTAAGIEFVKQYRDGGGTGTLYGMSIIDTDALLKALGPLRSRGYAFSVVLPLAHQTNRAVVREYLQLRQASTDRNLSARSIEGYIAAKALVKVLEDSKSLSAAGVTNAIAAAKSVDVGGYVLDFSVKDRTGSRFVDFAMFGADGKIIQ
jgi:ABC-type branched-subunit amino acid transport system substrate-binding protein